MIANSACSLSVLITVRVFMTVRSRFTHNLQYATMPTNLIFVGIDFLLPHRKGLFSI